MKALVLAAALAAPPVLAQERTDPYAAHHMDMPGVSAAIADIAALPAAADPHAGHDMAGMAGMEGMTHTGRPLPYSGVLGFYPLARDASGTSWRPDASPRGGVEGAVGNWTTTVRANLKAAYDLQSGPRGGDKAFVSGMLTAAARREFESGDTINLRAMLSLEPLMGRRGYPLLLAAGTSADGRARLVDRQPPHDLVTELSASYSRRLGQDDALFVYAALPGEPAFGPPAFMQRPSGLDSPEAPITRPRLEPTDIVFGVVTLGWVHRDWKVEASRFRGREPDHRRYDIETPGFDSTAVRLSWNPTPNWSVQTSWAELVGPEAFAPGIDEHRWSASALYTRKLGRDGLLAATGAWGRRRRHDGVGADAFLLEAAYKPNAAWTLFGRAERLATGALDPGPGAQRTVGKLSLGMIRDWRVAAHAKVGLGGFYSLDLIPAGLERAYGNAPRGGMGFVRLVID